MGESKYWDERANMGYVYKGERFYTITAIPYYYKRRKIILNKMISLINENTKICDFGCGDGEYIRKLSEINKDCTFHGVDISEDMVRAAKKRNKSDKITFEVSGDGIHKDVLFDFVYSSAVFAHIPDEAVLSLFVNIYNHIHKDGSFVLCEQSSPYRYSGNTFIRRPMSEYIALLEDAGFVGFESFVIDFWLHRLLFERKIGKMFINYYVKKFGEKNKHIIMVNLNSNLVYKFLSSLFSILSFPQIFKKKIDGVIVLLLLKNRVQAYANLRQGLIRFLYLRIETTSLIQYNYKI